MAWIVGQGLEVILCGNDASKLVAALDAGEYAQVGPHPVNGVEIQCQPLGQNRGHHVGHATTGTQQLWRQVQQQLIDQARLEQCTIQAVPCLHMQFIDAACAQVAQQGGQINPAVSRPLHHGGPTRFECRFAGQKIRIKMACSVDGASAASYK